MTWSGFIDVTDSQTGGRLIEASRWKKWKKVSNKVDLLFEWIEPSENNRARNKRVFQCCQQESRAIARKPRDVAYYLLHSYFAWDFDPLWADRCLFATRYRRPNANCHVIIFLTHQRDVTGRRKDGRTTCHSITALCRAWCGKKRLRT